MNLSVLVNHRFPGEDAVKFRERRRHFNQLLKLYLQRGRPATHARDKSHGLEPAPRYVPGPHRSHQPHEVIVTVQVIPWTDAVGVVHGMRNYKVLHPGTLVKQVRA